MLVIMKENKVEKAELFTRMYMWARSEDNLKVGNSYSYMLEITNLANKQIDNLNVHLKPSNDIKIVSIVEENNQNNYVENVTNIKEPAYLIIDDRCINFNGDYKELKEKIANFEVWYKRA